MSLDHGDFDVAKEEAGNVARYASGLEHLLATISDIEWRRRIGAK